MAWPTGQRTCSVPSVCWCASLVAGWLLAASLAFGQAPAPRYVSDCHPCSFSPGEGQPSFDFTFDLKPAGDGRVVQAVSVSRAGSTQPAQTLPVTGMTPVRQGEQFFFGGQDINLDQKSVV